MDDRAGWCAARRACGFDTGGIGKGLAADAVGAPARRLPAASRRLRRRHRPARRVGDPGRASADGRVRAHAASDDCGVATSGLNVRVWRRPDGSYAHHLLDPSTGEPAWTGLIGATAVAPTALEAETLSKLALLSGPAGARAALAEYGGIVVHDDGDVELIGPVRRAPRLRVSIPELAA